MKRELATADTGLRDQIAAVLMRDAFGLTTQTAALRQADAVIAELGLTHSCRECGGWGPMDD